MYRKSRFKEYDNRQIDGSFNDVKEFLSKALNTIEKETKEKMAKALRMEEDKAGYRLRTKYDAGYDDGYNQAIQEFNEEIDNYLKKHDK